MLKLHARQMETICPVRVAHDLSESPALFEGLDGRDGGLQEMRMMVCLTIFRSGAHLPRFGAIGMRSGNLVTCPAKPADAQPAPRSDNGRAVPFVESGAMESRGVLARLTRSQGRRAACADA